MNPSDNKDAVQIAIEICNENDFKNEMLSDDFLKEKIAARKLFWDEKVERLTLDLLKNYNLDDNQQDLVIGIVFSIAIRMLGWVEYFMGTFNLTRSFCIGFLEPSLFTSNGIIDSQKVAQELSKRSFSSMQDFQLASYFCLKDRIPASFKSMSKEDKDKFYNPDNPELIKQPDLIKFWSYFYMSELDKLKGNKSVDFYRLETALLSGSLVAVKYCLEKTSLKNSTLNIIEAAVFMINTRIERETSKKGKSCISDWVIFDHRKYNSAVDYWLPDQFFADIVYYLLSKLNKKHKTEVVRCMSVFIKITGLKNPDHIRTMENGLMVWPYQNEFLELWKSSWEFIPEMVYGSLLLRIVGRIGTQKGTLCYGENKSYDYRKMLREMWEESPVYFKKYMMTDKKIKYRHTETVLREGKQLLLKLFNIKPFTDDDRQTAMMILNSVTEEERKKFLFSREGSNVCIKLLNTDKIDLLDELISCALSGESAQDFKKRYSLMYVKDSFFEFIKAENYAKAEKCLQWTELTEEETDALKKELIKSEEGIETCIELSYLNPHAADRFVRFCIQTLDGFLEFKKSLLKDVETISLSEKFIKNNIGEIADKFIMWCLDTDDITEYKRTVALKLSETMKDESMLDNIMQFTENDFSDKFVDWKPAEDLCSWAFKSENDVNEFKLNILKNFKGNIILRFIKFNKWREANKFFSFIELSPEEILKFKKEYIFHESVCDLFDELVNCDEYDERFADLSKQDTIELFLEWFLVDIETVKEFRARYKCYDSVLLNIMSQFDESFKITP